MLLSCAALGTVPFARSCWPLMRPHFFCGRGGFAVVVWQMSMAWATCVAVTALKSATDAHAAGATVSELAGSQSSSTPLFSTSNAPGFTRAGVELHGPEASQQSPVQ